MSFTNWEVIDDGAWNGLRRLARYSDDDEGTVEVKTEAVHAINPIIETNKQAESIDKRRDLWKVGSIPAEVALKWLVEDGLDIWNPDHHEWKMRRLMDSDWRHLVPGLDRIIML